MKRRQPGSIGGGVVPEHLAHFDIDQWGGTADVGGAYDRWKAARREWVAAGNVWPGGPDQMKAEEFGTPLPDEPWDPSLI